ncbi:MAG: hypothetical protein JW809_01305 [Pirellulales bacterium]|nr:hypothetical protein [Pirellulales bacterium]
MSEPEIRLPQRPIPQFSLRSLLGVTALCAGLSSILAFAVRGHRWAIGAAVGLGSVVVLLAVCAALFLVVWVFAAGATRRAKAGGTPFAAPLPPGPDTTLTHGAPPP